MTKSRESTGRSARAGEPAGSTAVAIRIDYAPDTSEESIALLTRRQHRFAPDSTAPLAGGGARVLRARRAPGLVSASPRRAASA